MISPVERVDHLRIARAALQRVVSRLPEFDVDGAAIPKRRERHAMRAHTSKQVGSYAPTDALRFLTSPASRQCVLQHGSKHRGPEPDDGDPDRHRHPAHERPSLFPRGLGAALMMTEKQKREQHRPHLFPATTPTSFKIGPGSPPMAPVGALAPYLHEVGRDAAVRNVRSEGLEPPTYKFVACCSIQLSYDRTFPRLCGDPVRYPGTDRFPPTRKRFFISHHI